MSDKAQKEVRESKSCRMDQAIQSLDEVTSSLRRLKADILEEDQEGEDRPERGTPSLAQVLEEGPDRINKKNVQAMALIEDIRALLF